jgi:hypothetical protein
MISFGATTTRNEGIYSRPTQSTHSIFCEYTGDEIVVVDDFSVDEFTNSILGANYSAGNIKLYSHPLNGDFASHKNFLAEKMFWRLHFSGRFSMKRSIPIFLHIYTTLLIIMILIYI